MVCYFFQVAEPFRDVLYNEFVITFFKWFKNWHIKKNGDLYNTLHSCYISCSLDYSKLKQLFTYSTVLRVPLCVLQIHIYTVQTYSSIDPDKIWVDSIKVYNLRLKILSIRRSIVSWHCTYVNPPTYCHTSGWRGDTLEILIRRESTRKVEIS